MTDSKRLLKAVALRYRHKADRAPKVTAQGQGHLAWRIIEIAREHGVHIRNDPDLVEMLCKLNLHQEIPPELYRVVAEILVFIYLLHEQARPSSAGPPPAPTLGPRG